MEVEGAARGEKGRGRPLTQQQQGGEQEKLGGLRTQQDFHIISSAFSPVIQPKDLLPTCFLLRAIIDGQTRQKCVKIDTPSLLLPSFEAGP